LCVVELVVELAIKRRVCSGRHVRARLAAVAWISMVAHD
jgi:hypothetical protein